METRRKYAYEELLHLRTGLDGQVVSKNDLQFLELEKSFGSGQINCVYLDHGLMAMEWDITLKEDCNLFPNWTDKNVVYLMYCLKGNCFHKFHGCEEVNKLMELQTAVMFNDADNRSKFIIKKDDRLILNCIRIDLNKYAKEGKAPLETSSEGIITLLNSYNRKLGNFHSGKFNLEIGELIKMLENAKFANSVSSLIYFQGVCHMILAKQLEQFKIDLENGEEPATTLLKRELEIVSEVADFIKNYPEVQHSIKSISSKSGLSASKLQSGFKFMHNVTLGEYIRLIRLEKAEHLLRTTDLNISEVVYSIGFTSRSYFCKIFKKKYTCSPKTYKKRAQVQVPETV
ncbi:helix-turn-helix domain-containing protein [Maribacter aestuarii]|uniref:helix-turn-helix domain-containing protein n=1 Tax=Maribacter aestuarii TaxID=1130723 RepID=UPI00248D051E|nr:AraC family transcriptional regulator [Maribacter aestuarii]